MSLTTELNVIKSTADEEHGLVTTCSEQKKERESQGSTTRGGQERATLLLPGDAKAYFKCVCHLYEIFPELKYLPVNTSRLRSLLLQLCELQLFTTVRKLVVLFPEELDTRFLQSLVSIVCYYFA